MEEVVVEDMANGKGPRGRDALFSRSPAMVTTSLAQTILRKPSL